MKNAKPSKKKGEGNPRRGRAVKGGEDEAAVVVPGGSAAGPVAFDPAEVAEEMGMFWPSGKDSFILRQRDGRWAVYGLQATVDRMRALPGRMLAIKARDGEMLSEVKQVMDWVRGHRCLEAVLPALPGYKSGVHELADGERVLVKMEPRWIEPKAGEWPLVRGLIEGRLNLAMTGEVRAGGIDQTPWFYSWCKIALEARMRGEPGHWRAGHAMILTGPGGCGKNRLQEQIITPLLGGRFADPAKFLFEGDEFNGDVFKAEHLMLSEVPLPSQRTVDRTALAEKIKQVVANPSQRMRLMREEPATVCPFWRLTISVNDDPDKLRSLPLITSDFGDKVLIFHCQAAEIPGLVGNSPEEQRAWREAIAAELPAFFDWLLNVWEVPEGLTKYDNGKDATRFGFREFHHPVIKGELFDDTPHAQLLSMINAAEFAGRVPRTFEGEEHDDELWERQDRLKLWDLPCKGKWEAVRKGSAVLPVWFDGAEELQRVLTGETGFTCTVETMAKKLFQHNKLTSLLSRLANDVDVGALQVVQDKTRHWRGWKIGPPVDEGNATGKARP